MKQTPNCINSFIMYNNFRNRIHDDFLMYIKSQNRVHEIAVMYPKSQNRVHEIAVMYPIVFDLSKLRESEQQKIKCGKANFSIYNDLNFAVASKVKDLII